MKITAITRYKHGKLLEMLKQLGWTQSELAKRCGVAPGKIGDVMNLVRRPSETLAIKIQNAFGEAGHYFDPLEEWPETFTGVGRGFLIMQSQDCDPVQFVGLNEAMQIEAPQSGEFEGGDLMDTLNTELATFSAREQKVIQMRYFQGLTYDTSAKVIGLTRERVRQIEAKVLRRLRSPERKKLAEWKTENALL